jgi:hypothetical protein
MQEVTEVALLLFEIYLALGVMLIGAGFMVLGKNGGSRVARWYFGNSLRWLWWRMRSFFTAVLSAIFTALMFWVLRPLAYHLWRGLRWLATREAGWLRR